MSKNSIYRNRLTEENLYPINSLQVKKKIYYNFSDDVPLSTLQKEKIRMEEELNYKYLLDYIMKIDEMPKTKVKFK